MLPQRATAMLAQLDAWAAEHRGFLTLVWERFSRDAMWPNAQLLARELFAEDRRLGLTSIGRQMPPTLGRLDVTEGTIALTLRGMSYVEEGRGLASSYVTLLRVAIERFASPGRDPEVRTPEFAALLDLSPLQVRLLEAVALLETWALRPHGGQPGDRVFVIDEHVVYVIADVQTVSDYLDAQAAAWWPDGQPATNPFAVPLPATAGLSAMAEDPRQVAVAYGRDGAARRAMFGFLRDLGLVPLEWERLIHETGHATPYSGEAVERAFAIAQAVVVLFTPDDEVRLHPTLVGADAEPVTMQPRPNVLIEAGMALATHAARTVIVEIGAIRPVSNLSGRNVIRLGSDAAALHALARRLGSAGCPIDQRGQDWLSVERFAALDAMVRSPTIAPVLAAAPGASEESDNLALEVEAAARDCNVHLSERQLSTLTDFLRGAEERFDSSQVARLLPAPTVRHGDLKRVFTRLHLNGVLPRAPDGRGFLRPGHPDAH